MFPKISHVINDGPMMTQWWPDLGGDRRFPMWCSWSILAMWTTQQGSSQHHWWYWKITRWKIWSWVDYPLVIQHGTHLKIPHHTKKADKKKSNVATCLFIKSHRAICLRATPFLSGSSPSSCDSCEPWGLEWEFRRSANLDGTGSQEDWSGQWVPIHNIHV